MPRKIKAPRAFGSRSKINHLRSSVRLSPSSAPRIFRPVLTINRGTSTLRNPKEEWWCRAVQPCSTNPNLTPNKIYQTLKSAQLARLRPHRPSKAWAPQTNYSWRAFIRNTISYLRKVETWFRWAMALWMQMPLVEWPSVLVNSLSSRTIKWSLAPPKAATASPRWFSPLPLSPAWK